MVLPSQIYCKMNFIQKLLLHTISIIDGMLVMWYYNFMMEEYRTSEISEISFLDINGTLYCTEHGIIALY